MRYVAHTLDGSVIFRADSPEQLRQGVTRHLKEGRKPALGYTFTNKPNCKLPYAVWTYDKQTDVCVGQAFSSFDEVCAHWGR